MKQTERMGGLDFNGSGISAWNWDISFSLILCARPSLLLPFHLPHHTQPPPRAMLPLRWAHPGKRVASRVKTLLSNLMERYGALLIRS